MAETDSTGDLVRRAVGDVKEMASAQIQLGFAEFREDVLKLKRIAPMAASGSVLGLGAALLGLQSVALALALTLPAWAAFAIVAGASALAAGILFVRVRSAINGEDFAPRRTLASLKETSQWMERRLG
jgi:hypothetical protein